MLLSFLCFDVKWVFIIIKTMHLLTLDPAGQLHFVHTRNFDSYNVGMT